MKNFHETRMALGLSEGNRQSKAGAQLGDEALNLLKILSHDLRGSLVSISATLKLLDRGYYGKIEEGAEKKLKELLEKVTHLIGISDECLDRVFSTEGSFDLEQEVVDLRQDIIHPVLEEFSSEIKDHHLKVDNHLEDLPARRLPIKTNRVCLKTIFRNLLKNAIQYGDKGGTIAFGFEIRGSSYRLNVYNSGRSIPETWRDRLFNNRSPIERDDHPSNGMGLGLYLIKRILQKLGGNISYEAKEHGSSFILTLPIEAH